VAAAPRWLPAALVLFFTFSLAANRRAVTVVMSAATTENTMNASQPATRTITGTCTRCDGSGSIRAFGHYANGTCFACHGTGTLTVQLTEADAAARDAAREQGQRQRAWLAALATVSPAQVVANFRALPEAKLWAVRDACAGWDAEGARLAWWAASTVLGAWPNRALPASWLAEAAE
jgi:hypothetical protein